MNVASNVGIYNLNGTLRGIGLGSPAASSWDAYPALSPTLRGALDTMMTPAAYRAMHYHPETFGGIFGLRELRFEALPIFRICKERNPAPEPTKLEGFSVMRGNSDPIVDTLESEADRSAYRPIFAESRDTLEYNFRLIHHPCTAHDAVDLLIGMGFSFAMQRTDMHLVLLGFYPYFSAPGEECMLFFSHAALGRLALIVAPLAERDHALRFILTHGVLHTFDKVCASCGRTGGLRKCTGSDDGLAIGVDAAGGADDVELRHSCGRVS